MYFAVFTIAILAGVSSLFYTAASQAGRGNRWADDLCYSAELLCRHPDWPLAAAGVLLGIALTVKLMQAIRG